MDNFQAFPEKKIKPREQLKDTTTFFPIIQLPNSLEKMPNFSSRYLVIDFWYKACAPCLLNMKQLDKINFNSIQVVSINVRDSVDADIQKIMSKHSFTFLFKGDELAKQLNINAYPTLYLIDLNQNRKILYKHIGYDPTGAFLKTLEKLSQGE